MIQKARTKIYNLLRWSERYAQTDMVYLAKGGFWLTAGKFISSAASFLLSIAFANLIPKETYGIYKYVLSIVGLLAISNLTGMESSLVRSIAQGFEGSFKKAFFAKVKWGIFGSLLGIGFAIYYYTQQNWTLTICFLMSAVFIPLMDPLEIHQAILGGKKDFKLSAKFSAIGQIFGVFAMILALVTTKNIALIIFAYFAANTFIRYVLLKITLKKFPLNQKVDPETVSYGKHLSVMNFFGILSAQADKILLWHFLGAAPLAIYSFALAPISQISNSLKSVNQLFLPKLAEKDKEVIKKTLPKKMIKFYLLMFFIILTYIILAPFLYKVFFPQYLEAVNYSRVYALVLLFFPQKLLSTALLAYGQKKGLYIVSTISPIIKLSLFFILIPIFGVWGAIYAMFSPFIFNAVALSYYFRKM